MKLIKCYVSSFGKLQDFSYDFTSGLNTIKQDNGWGKSTLATFIKAMFYGITSSKKSVAENERIKYKPWNSTAMFGGFVEFEWGDKIYKIERFFGNKESEDTVRLFDVQTGKEYPNTENLGKRIFEIDEDGFLSTTYLSQKDFEIKSNSSLTAKFNAVCEVQDSEAFDNALVKLEEKSKKYKMRGDKGLISETRREIVVVDEQILSVQKSLETIKVLQQDIAILEQDCNNLKKECNVLAEDINNSSERQAIKVKKAHFESLQRERKQVVEKIKEIDHVFNNNQTSQGEINNYIALNNDLVSTSANINTLKSDIENLKNLQPVNNVKKGLNICLILGAVLAVLGIGLAFNKLFIGLGAVLIGAILIIIGIVCNKPNVQAVSPYEQLIKEKQAEYEKLVDLSALAMQKINEFLGKFALNTSDNFTALNSLSKAFADRENLYENLKNLDKKLKEYDGDLAAFTKDLDTNVNVEELRRKFNFAQNEFSKKSSELAGKKASLINHENIANSIVELEAKKAELTENLNVYQREYNLTEKTIEFLKLADQNLKIKYRAPLQSSLNKYLKYIDQNENAQIDIDLNLTVNENGGNKAVDYYSKGYQNLYDICKRFALTDVLFTGEKPFIILDDPFYNLDDAKLERAIELIKNLSNEYQILYLVCHESRRG